MVRTVYIEPMTSTSGDPNGHEPVPSGSYEPAPLDYPADYPDRPMFAGPPPPPARATPAASVIIEKAKLDPMMRALCEIIELSIPCPFRAIPFDSKFQPAYSIPRPTLCPRSLFTLDDLENLPPGDG